MYYDNQNINNQEMMELRKREAARQARQDERDYNLDAQRVAQGWANIENNKNKAETKEETKRRQASSTLNTVAKALNEVEQNPNAFGFWKGLAPSDVTNRTDLAGAQSRAIVEGVTAEYRKYLTGAQMSDKERKDYEKFLPNSRDNAEIIKRKLKGMQMVISAREGLELPTNTNLNVDKNALEAEMKRRGML
jgi:hypothetical protein